MFGKYRHTLDAKGRLIVPSKLRDEFGPSFYVAKSQQGCLKVYTEDEWQRKLEALKTKTTASIPDMRYFFANICRCEPDKQGRFLLPEDFRQFAELTQDVMFIGQATFAEIWNAERYEADEAKFFADPKNIAAIMEALEF